MNKQNNELLQSNQDWAFFSEHFLSDNRLLKIINGALKSTIIAHGPITREFVSSASKRIIHSMKDSLKSDLIQKHHSPIVSNSEAESRTADRWVYDNWDWLLSEYPGQWIIVKEDGVITFCADLKIALREARSAGVKITFAIFVPGAENDIPIAL